MLIIQIWFNIDDMFYDLGISRIVKILVKFCPKFLGLYASIHGNLKTTKAAEANRKKMKIF